MTDLQQIIEKAEKGGWENDSIGIKKDINLDGYLIAYDDYDLGIESIIFDHSFLKAFFGKDWPVPGKNLAKIDWGEYWQYHARQLVLAENRLEYLKSFL